MSSRVRYWYTDASHGWLKVKYSELEKLGIQAKIGPYSYRNGDDVFLEEDFDAMTYINAMNKKGIALYFRSGSNANDRPSRVRNYTPYFFTVTIPKGKLIAGDSMDKQKETV